MGRRQRSRGSAPAAQRLAAPVEEFLRRVVLIDELQREVDELQQVESLAGVTLRQLIAESRIAIREAQAYLRRVSADRRRRERRLVKLRGETTTEASSSLRRAHRAAVSAHAGAELAAGRQMLSQ